jgi:Zn-dependent protease with chaperone function
VGQPDPHTRERPHVIVVTTAAREALTEPELSAVLAHEQAHLAGRHHHILTLVRAFAQGLPHLPVFAQAPTAIARALEMCADDAAARRHSTAVLLSGLIKLAGQPAMAAHRMGAADSALVTRALRLAAPPCLASQWGLRLFTLVAIAITLATPVVGEWLCH